MKFLAPFLLLSAVLVQHVYGQTARPVSVVTATVTASDGSEAKLISNIGFESEEACKAFLADPPDKFKASLLLLIARLEAENVSLKSVQCEAPKEPV